MTREDIVSRVHFYISEANKIWNQKLDMPEVTFYTKGASAGLAKFISHELSFNEVLAKENTDTFENTIIHEVAHLVTFRVYPNAKQKHGPEFREVCQTLGGSGNTYHTYDVSSVAIKRTKTRYIYVCRDCSFKYELTKQKHDKAYLYRCKCNGVISFTGDIRRFK